MSAIPIEWLCYYNEYNDIIFGFPIIISLIIEFDEAFQVFSGNESEMSTANSVLIPFLRQVDWFQPFFFSLSLSPSLLFCYTHTHPYTHTHHVVRIVSGY